VPTQICPASLLNFTKSIAVKFAVFHLLVFTGLLNFSVNLVKPPSNLQSSVKVQLKQNLPPKSRISFKTALPCQI